MSSPAVSDLVNALRADTVGPEWFSGRVAPDEDLVLSALVLGLAPRLHWRLEHWGLALEPRAMAKLSLARRAGKARFEAIQAQLIEILLALNERDIMPILLKGPVLAARVYPGPELRPMNDIDLLLRPAALEAADQVLTGLGYERRTKSEKLGPGIRKHTRTYRRPGGATQTPNPYLSPDAERTVEPHGSLEESWFGLRCDITPGVHERSQPFAAGTAKARALSAEDQLLHLCVHLAFHLIMGSPSFVQLMDIDLCLREIAGRGAGYFAPFQWGDFLRLVRSCNAAPFVYASFSLAGNVWGSPVPSEVDSAFSADCPPGLRRYARQLRLADLLARTQRPPLTGLPQRLWRGLEDRLETSRWAVGLAAKWQVWRTLFDVAHTDTGQLLLRRLNRALQSR